MRPILLFGAAVSVFIIGTSASAESLAVPSQLHTHSLFAEVEFASLQDSSLSSFVHASQTSESVFAAIMGIDSYTAVIARTQGTTHDNLDQIRFSFTNNLNTAVRSNTNVKFSLAHSADISLGGLLPGGPNYLGDHAIELWGNRSKELLGTLDSLEQSIQLDAYTTYELRLELSGNTDSSGSWGSWVFDIEYSQSIPIPGPAGLAVLMGCSLIRRRRR